MAAKPWELVLPIEEMSAPNMIVTKTSHRTPSAALLGRKEREGRRVISAIGF